MHNRSRQSFKGVSFLFILLLGILFVNGQEKINFRHARFEEFIEESKKSGKPVMIYFTGTGCTLCVKMERQVFPQPEIYQLFNNSFINIESFDDFHKPDSSIKKLRERYGIVSQPTFIFIDSTGRVIHKAGYKTSEAFLMVGKQALGNDNYRSWTDQFDKGEYKTDIIIKFLSVEQSPRLYAEDGYKCKAQEVLDRYFSSIPASEYSEEKNWDIIERFVANPYSSVFNYLLTNQHVFNKKYGEEAVNKKIFNVYNDAWSGNTDSEAFKNAGKTIQLSGHPMAKLLILVKKMKTEASINMTENKTGWERFVIKYNPVILKYSYLLDPYWLYSMTDDITIRTPNDLKSVTASNKWMENMLRQKENEDEDYLSVYARTLLLLGKKNAAIEAQKKAVEVAVRKNLDPKEIDEYKKVLTEYSK